MATIMTKRGDLDHIVTYEFICDTAADMSKIEPRYITLGSTCIVIQGESGELEVYMANSKKQWASIMDIGSSGSSSNNTSTITIDNTTINESQLKALLELLGTAIKADKLEGASF